MRAWKHSERAERELLLAAREAHFNIMQLDGRILIGRLKRCAVGRNGRAWESGVFLAEFGAFNIEDPATPISYAEAARVLGLTFGKGAKCPKRTKSDCA